MVAVLAGVGTSGSSPNFRNWPLAAAATAASWMSFMAAAAFCSSWSTILVFTNGARGEIPDPLGALTSVAKPIHTLFVTGGGLALLPVLLVAIWAITQVKIKSGWAVGAAACLVLAAGTLLVDQVTAKGISAFIQKLVSQGPSQSLTEIPTGKSDLTGLGVLTAPPSTPSYVPPMVAPKGENPKVEGGIPSGVPGGVTGGVVGGILGGQPPPPPPPAEKSTQQTEPIRLSSNVLMSKLIKHVAPVYPELARQARVQGVVSLRIIIDKTGHVANIAVVNGHPLLIQAATDAVSQWVFEATIINGEAVSVSGVVTVQFTLTGAKE
jgi:TonB family protein